MFLRKILTVLVFLWAVTGSAWAENTELAVSIDSLPSNLNISEAAGCNLNIATKGAVRALDLKDLRTGAYCICGTRVKGNARAYESEGDVRKIGETEGAKCVSSIEKQVLEAKKSFGTENRVSFFQRATGSGGTKVDIIQMLLKPPEILTLEDSKALVGLRGGLDCGGVKNAGLCGVDERLYEQKLNEDAGRFSIGVSTKFDVMLVRATNWIIGTTNDVIGGSIGSNLSFFDILPPLGYTTKDAFGKTTIGYINAIMLMLVAGFILIFIWLKTYGKETPGWISFGVLLTLVIGLTAGFPTFYGYIQLFINSVGDSIGKTSADFGINTMTSTGVVRFGNGDNYYFDGGFWGVILAAINTLIIIFLGAVVTIRNFFFLFISYFVSICSIGLILGKYWDADYMQGRGKISATLKLSTEGFFWIIGLFISFAISTLLFRMVTLVFASFTMNGVSMLRAVESLGFAALLYLIMVVGVIVVWFKYMIRPTMEFVSGAITMILFGQKTTLAPQNFFASLASAHEGIRANIEEKRKFDPKYAMAAGTFEKVAGTMESAFARNKAFQKLSSAIEFTAAAGRVLDPNGRVRRGVGAALDVFGGTVSAAKRAVRAGIELSAGYEGGRGFKWSEETDKLSIIEGLDRDIQRISGKLKDDPDNTAMLAYVVSLENKKTELEESLRQRHIRKTLRKVDDDISKYKRQLDGSKTMSGIEQRRTQEVILKKMGEGMVLAAEDSNIELRKKERSLASKIDRKRVVAEHADDDLMAAEIEDGIVIDKQKLSELQALRQKNEQEARELQSLTIEEAEGLQRDRHVEILSRNTTVGVIKNAAAAVRAADNIAERAGSVSESAKEARSEIIGASPEKVAERTAMDQISADGEKIVRVANTAADAVEKSVVKAGGGAFGRQAKPETIAAAVVDVSKIADPAERGFAEKFNLYMENVRSGGDPDDTLVFEGDELFKEVFAAHIEKTGGDISGIFEDLQDRMQSIGSRTERQIARSEA